ncbi:ribonuclease inhibitor-like [Oreochromis niloticus]|uniref:ribonuclease inhibitor-like n=1 Tax=Oreochromis niloticus TaxID=8128 RepID=UPI000DF2E770|nr:ribonuclease inhibitor-like [Oreochromis niloticus]
MTPWFGNSCVKDQKALQRVIRTAERCCRIALPPLQQTYARRCRTRAAQILKDPSHPGNKLFQLLRSGRRFRIIRARTERLKRSFYPQAIRARAQMSSCFLSERSCEALSSVLSSQPLSLKELDLSNNNLRDSGVKLLSAALQSQDSTVKTLRLTVCNLSERSCEALSSVLSSQSSCLKELDLSDNNLKNSGVKILSDAVKSPHCTLETLSLSHCLIREEGCTYLASALSSNPSHLRELDLSYNHPGDSVIELLSLNDIRKLSGVRPKAEVWLQISCYDLCGKNKPLIQVHLHLPVPGDLQRDLVQVKGLVLSLSPSWINADEY